MGRITYVVRQNVTVPRHLERFNAWLDGEQIPDLRARIAQIEGVRRYRGEKDEKLFMTFYDLGPDVAWGPEAQRAVGEIRAAWGAFAPDMRDLSATPYEEVWRGGPGTTGPGPHPLIVERLSIWEKDREFDRWSEEDLWPTELRNHRIARVYRYRALVGEPRFRLQVQEFEDDATMREKIKASEPGSYPKYWADWASWMPQVENLTRLVFLPV